MNSWINLFSGILIISLAGCDDQNQSQTQLDQSQLIVDRAIEAMGGSILDQSEISFDFRDQSLTYFNDHGTFRYTRTFPDTVGNTITDTLTNHDFIRYLNTQKLDLSDEEKSLLKEGVNSIIYFAFLPYKLNDPGVRKQYLGQVTVGGESYEKIRVDFPENENSETAHNDVYFYYFDPDDYSLDYLAYEFEENGGGIRFRSAYNVRQIDGITIQDYINYLAEPDSVDYSQIETYYNQNQLQELSRVELENIQIRSLDDHQL